MIVTVKTPRSQVLFPLVEGKRREGGGRVHVVSGDVS